MLAAGRPRCIRRTALAAVLAMAPAAMGTAVLMTAACGDESDRDGAVQARPDGMVADAGSATAQVDAATIPRSDRSLDASTIGTDAATFPVDASGSNTDSGASSAVMRGGELAKEKECSSCHQESYAGSGFFPNITPDTTAGIGGWSDQEIGNAITKGAGRDGGVLCALMMRYAFSADELSDLIAFLRSLLRTTSE